MTPYEVMKRAIDEGYEGSISELMQQQLIANDAMMSADVATTQEEAETGLLEGPPRSMIIPGAESITTEGMDYPIDITTIDRDTGMVNDHIPNVQPGQLIETGKGVDVLETPSMMTGGYLSERRRKIEEMRCGGKKRSR